MSKVSKTTTTTMNRLKSMPMGRGLGRITGEVKDVR